MKFKILKNNSAVLIFNILNISTKYIILLIYLVIVFGCKEEFLLSSKLNTELLVVEGGITNQPGPYSIRLSLTAPFNQPQILPYSGCTITLYENTGNFEVLNEIEDGVYVTSETGIQGIPGNEYRISIVSPAGKTYETEFQEMKALIEIDSIYAKETSVESLEYAYNVPGYQFYINSKTASTQDNYFLWSMTETFEYDVDHSLSYIETYTPYGEIIITYFSPTYDSLRTCWHTQNVKYVFTAKTSNLNVPRITNQPLHFVSTESKKLTKKYFIQAKQYTIDKEAYNYWQIIESQSSSDNILGSSQPYTIGGNLKNINNQDEMVLGYFTVASVSQKSLFVDALRGPFYYSTCIVALDIEEFKKTHDPPYFWVENDDGVLGLTYESCLDCRNEGGGIEKPDFWIY